MNNPLYERLRMRNPKGLPYEEAVQIFVLIFCTTECLPDSLRNEVYTENVLVETFENLAGDGLILPPQKSGTSAPAGQGFVEWRDLVKEFLSGRVAQDFSFPNRLHRYL